jgi:hypothetical protein
MRGLVEYFLYIKLLKDSLINPIPLSSGVIALSLFCAVINPAFARSSAIVAGKAVPPPVAVTTYHNDTLRTGWNPNETTLTPAVVKSGAFKQVVAVAVDEQVDAEPLYVPNLSIPGLGKRNVVYVVTQNDTVYAIDADAGTILFSRNLGAPVPLSVLLGQCNNNGKKVGITGTPVIDLARQAFYVVTYTLEQGTPVYRIHALALSTLADVVPSRVITGSRALTNAQAYKFDPISSRQRAALVEANGAVYAAFTSFCDINADETRGWVLGWNAATLSPLAGQALTNRLSSSPNDYFLSTIWMSGYGIAADESGSLFFVTGNSDPKGNTENGTTSFGESVVKLSPDLTRVQSYFTPSGRTLGAAYLDQHDGDFGAGGVMLVPAASGQPRLAVAAGKAGVMYLMNRDSLGGHAASGPDQVFATYDIGMCLCGASYYVGADGTGRVISSGGLGLMVWKVAYSKKPRLIQESDTTVGSQQYQGFFTAVSSNGTQAGSQVIWAVSRPVSRASPTLRLFAFDPSHINKSGESTPIFTAPAGTWPNTGGNPNTVPLVANGRVYVGGYQSVAIFGLGNASSHIDSNAVAAAEPSADSQSGGHVLYGTVISSANTAIMLRSRTHTLVTVDAALAMREHRAVPAVKGQALLVRGEYDARGMLHAETILHAKDLPALWDADR